MKNKFLKTIFLTVWQCEVSDQMLKSEFKDDPTVFK